MNVLKEDIFVYCYKKEQICEKFVKNRYKLELLKITN